MYKQNFLLASLLTMVLTVALTACTMISPQVQDETVPAEGENGTLPSNPESAEMYVDPSGLFSAPIPTNWVATTESGYARFASPDDGILIYLLAVENEDSAQAIASAWEMADPAFDRPIDQQIDAPPQGGLDALTVINYEFDEENERFYQGVARLYDGMQYILLVNGKLADLQQRQAQISIIDSGLTITALNEVNLAEMEPLPLTDVLPELERFIEVELERFAIPGAAVAIVQDGEVAYSRGFGMTEAGGKTPMTPQTHMMIGSTGKSLTTMLIATLVDQGVMTWDTPVIEVLPEFAVSDPELTESITLRNLVCACTGVPRRDFELIFNANDLNAEGIVDSLATFEFFTDFGEAFQYSNQLVATGGYAAVAANGTAYGDLFSGYADALQANVFDPIGMENTTVFFADVEAGDNYAIPHSAALDGSYMPIPMNAEELLIPIMPAGSHWSTLDDMTRYMLTELALGVAPDGTRVVSAENLQETWEPQVPVSADTDYGLGWFVSDYKGLALIDHGGNTLGFTSSFGFLPEIDLGVIVLTNAQGSNPFNNGVRTRLLELLFAQEAEVETALQFVYEQGLERIEELNSQIEELDPSTVEGYLGLYENEALGDFDLRLEDGELLADVGEFVMTLLPVADEDEPETIAGYLTMTPPIQGALFEFEEDENGVPVITFGAGAVSYTFTPVE